MRRKKGEKNMEKEGSKERRNDVRKRRKESK